MFSLFNWIIDFSSCSLSIRPLLMFQLQTFIWAFFAFELVFTFGIGSRDPGSPIGTEFGCRLEGLLD